MEKTGKITQVIGPVVDVAFEDGMPPVYEKLIAPATGAVFECCSISSAAPCGVFP